MQVTQSIEDYNDFCLHCKATAVHRLTVTRNMADRLVVEVKVCLKCNKTEKREIRI